jgi:hypothetical protein
VFVTADPASTEKFFAVPSSGVEDELALAPTATVSVSAAMTTAAEIPIPAANLRMRERMAQSISVTGISRGTPAQPAAVRYRNRDAHSSAYSGRETKRSPLSDSVE